jgi:hypothetical protein
MAANQLQIFRTVAAQPACGIIWQLAKSEMAGSAKMKANNGKMAKKPALKYGSGVMAAAKEAAKWHARKAAKKYSAK